MEKKKDECAINEAHSMHFYPPTAVKVALHSQWVGKDGAYFQYDQNCNLVLCKSSLILIIGIQGRRRRRKKGFLIKSRAELSYIRS